MIFPELSKKSVNGSTCSDTLEDERNCAARECAK